VTIHQACVLDFNQQRRNCSPAASAHG